MRPRRPARAAASRSFLSRAVRVPARLALATLLCAGLASDAAPAGADVLVSNFTSRPGSRSMLVWKNAIGRAIRTLQLARISMAVET